MPPFDFTTCFPLFFLGDLMRSLLSFGVALVAMVSAGPLMAQSCCSSGAAAPSFNGAAVQPIQNYSGANYAGANYAAPLVYSSPVVNRTTYAPRAYSARTFYPQRSYAAPIARRISSTYMKPTYSSSRGGYRNRASSAPTYSYAPPPAIQATATSSACGGCGCGCAKTGSCGCGH